MTGQPDTLEGWVVRYSDKKSRIFTMMWMMRSGEESSGKRRSPRTYTDILGHSSKERLNTMIHDIVAQSQGKPSITMSEDVEFAFRGMRRYV